MKQIIAINGLQSQFLTHPKISVKEVKKFVCDISSILKELDPSINYEGEVFTFYGENGTSIWNTRNNLNRIERNLQVVNGEPGRHSIDDIEGTHNIIYRPFPPDLENWMKEALKNNRYGHILKVRPNLTISSNPISYSASTLVDKLENLKYVNISDCFNGEIYDAERLESAQRVVDGFYKKIGLR